MEKEYFSLLNRGTSHLWRGAVEVGLWAGGNTSYVNPSNSHVTYLLQVTQFCDNDTSDPSNYHVTEAPHKHNRLCDLRSNWEVMREHPDFQGLQKNWIINFKDCKIALPRIRLLPKRICYTNLTLMEWKCPLRLDTLRLRWGYSSIRVKITPQSATIIEFSLFERIL